MRYLAHINKYGDEQTVKEHLENTAVLCGKFAESFGAYDAGYCCGLLHDIGKYSLKFQQRIRGSEQRVDHATAGAKVCWEKKGMYQFLSYCIAGHHAGLPDTGGSGDISTDGTMTGRMRKKLEDFEAYAEEIKIPMLGNPPFQPVKSENIDFFFSMFIRMLYSCLVDADYLDTESFMNRKERVREQGETIAVLCDRLEKHISDWLKQEDLSTVNGRRTEILKHCMKMGEANKGLFRLTVPTGGGKTIASLAFALKHAEKHHMDRVIYVIPYTSIIEQNAKVFRDILGDENVLESHCNVDYESVDELRPMHLASENWDKPIVVTTNVQFFESLFANKSSKCRKLHNIANSVIIFDEAQMLPNDYLKPCTAMIEELINNYEVSAVLCTATQPALKSFFKSGILATELCPRMEEQFEFFKRTVFEDTGILTEEKLVKKINKEYQALCIVNTKKRAQRLYRMLEGEGIYHLSTSMYPKHRNCVLQEIRNRLRRNERCILVSTSLVEAGVDLDFCSVYRELAGIDAMIQAAGRCNREGKRALGESKVFVFRFEGKQNILGQRQQIDVAKSLISDGRNISDAETVTKYFEMLYHIKGDSLDKKKILDEFQGKNMKYNFAKVGKEFKLIEQNTKTIFINREEVANEILIRLKERGVTRLEMRKAGQYCVTVYDQEFDKMYGMGILQQIAEGVEDFYELTDSNKYTNEMGLELEIDDGAALFF